jgi:hypothetical protein
MEWRWRLEVHQCPINLLPESGDPQSYTCRQQHGVLREQCNQYAPGKECSANVMENHWLIPIISDILCHAGSSGCSSSLAPSIQSMNQYSRRWISRNSLTYARSSSLGPPQENCQRQYPSNWSVNVCGST